MKNINKSILSAVLFTILTMVISAAAQTPKPPKFLLINGLKEDANWVLQADNPDDILNGKIVSFRYESVDADKKRAESVLKKIKDLMDSGTSESENIELASGPMTLGALSEKVLALHKGQTKVMLTKEFFQAGTGTKAFVDDISSGKMVDSDAYGDPLAAAKHHSERLLKAVTEAQKLDFPEDFDVEIYGQKYTIPQLKEMAVYVLTNSKIQKEAIVAARNAKDVPFLKVLTGDKARIFKEEFGGLGGEWLCMGGGGNGLTTPEQMKSASAWFTYGNTRGIVDTWHITGYHFSGDKLVRTSSKSGYGLKPPASAFR